MLEKMIYWSSKVKDKEKIYKLKEDTSKLLKVLQHYEARVEGEEFVDYEETEALEEKPQLLKKLIEEAFDIFQSTVSLVLPESSQEFVDKTINAKIADNYKKYAIESYTPPCVDYSDIEICDELKACKTRQEVFSQFEAKTDDLSMNLYTYYYSNERSCIHGACDRIIETLDFAELDFYKDKFESRLKDVDKNQFLCRELTRIAEIIEERHKEWYRIANLYKVKKEA